MLWEPASPRKMSSRPLLQPRMAGQHRVVGCGDEAASTLFVKDAMSPVVGGLLMRLSASRMRGGASRARLADQLYQGRLRSSVTSKSCIRPPRRRRAQRSLFRWRQRSFSSHVKVESANRGSDL